VKKSIAVIGVSQKEDKFGHRIFRDLLNSGYDVRGVNPAGGELLGSKIYRSLLELDPAPEMVITVVNPSVTERVVEECRQRGIKEIWMQPGSGSEAAVEKARAYGMQVTSNACFMLAEGIW
jgi:hypothetical protein